MLELFLAEERYKKNPTKQNPPKKPPQNTMKIMYLQETSAVKKLLFITESHYLQLHSYHHYFVSSEQGAALNAKS